MSHNSPLPFFLKKIRGTLREPGKTDSSLRSLIEQAADFWGEDQDDLEFTRYGSEMAFTLAAVIGDVRDNAVRKAGLETLLDLGPVGEVLALSFIQERKVTGEALNSLFSPCSESARLLLLNRFFLLPRPVDPRMVTWAFDALKSIQGENPEEALIFLETLSERGEPVAYPVQREFLRGRFGVWLQKLLDLDLDEEQIRYMARTAGLLESDALAQEMAMRLKKGGEQTLVALLEGIGGSGAKQNPRLIKAATLFLKHGSDHVRLCALRTMLRLRAPGVVYGFLYLHKNASLRKKLYPLLFKLQGDQVAAFLEKLDEPERKRVLNILFSMLARLDPKGLIQALDNPEKDTANNKAGTETLKKFASSLKEWVPAPYFKTPPFKRQAPPEEESGLFSQVKEKLMGSGKAAEESPGVRALRILKPGQTVKGQTAKDGNLSYFEFSKAVFKNSNFINLDLHSCLFREVRFEKCTFKNVDFKGSEFLNSVFQDCGLTNCLFSESLVKNTGFRGCTLKGAHFAAATLEDLQTNGCLFAESDFWGASLKGWTGGACAFKAAQFSLSTVTDVKLDGIEFKDCLFEKTMFQNVSLQNADAAACSFSECLVSGLETDDPEFLAEQGRANLKLLTDMAEKDLDVVPSGLDAPETLSLMLQVLDRFLFEKDAKERERIFLTHNQKRTRWAAAKGGALGSDFLKIMPDLLELGAVVHKKGYSPAKACAVSGYCPGHAANALLQKYVGRETLQKIQQEARQRGAKAVPIEAVYSIGSIGTIAQTGTSDLDIWVCCEEAKTPEKDVGELKAKLSALEPWVGEVFGLEVHFFVMGLKDIRENNFGFSDKESAGSTQGLLLKEEFYRTVVHLAGKKPFWWYVPVKTTGSEYSSSLAKLQTAAFFPARDVVDLGHLERAPKEEFFGASLWQIVKALKNPFKSVMKFALLDKYFAAKETQSLVCDRIKERLLSGATDLWDVDAYALLFREIFEHYQKTGNKEGRELMRLAFLQKTGFTASSRTTGISREIKGGSFVEYFYPDSGARIAADISPAPGTALEQNQAGFSEMAVTGEKVSRFMFSTYENIQDRIGRLDLDVFVAKEDQAKLGRKIFSRFSLGKDKIMRIPFVDSPKGLFKALDFSCEGMPGTPMTWIAKGEAAVSKGKKTDLEEIRRDKLPVRLLTWLVANHLYHPGLHVQGGTLQNPVSIDDVRELLRTLHDFFPHEATFETDVEENLRDEQAVRVFMVMNFAVPREDDRILDVNLIYSTNWGELFCAKASEALPLLEKSPREFLKQNIGPKLSPEVQVEIFKPRRSLCPKVTIF
ncbi:MAG: class I adenylate cyclase [Thermodesulfobacteriota bacterium]|nr:class I adenylate cyclase [Thermodesulfobacteriota bacterium]